MITVTSKRLSIWRLKEDTTFQDALGDGLLVSSGTEFFIGDNSRGLIISRQLAQKSPNWVKFLQQAAGVRLADLTTQSAAALLLVESSGRLYALTFGQSRHWLNKDRIDRRFGMLVTINAVGEDSLRSIDKEEFESVQRKTRTQTSAESSVGQFGIDIQRDLLRSVTGKPTDISVADQLTGADSLTGSFKITLDSLPEKLDQLGKLADSEDYKTRGFGWIDHFKRVTDSETINRLDEKLVSDIKNRNLERIFLAAPSGLDYQEHIGYLYPRERFNSAIKHDDLRIDVWRDMIDDAAIDISKLKSEKIRHYKGSSEYPSDKFSIYDAIIYEKREPDFLYALTGSEWYEVDNDHVKAVEKELDTVPLCNIVLPPANVGEHEGAYNTRVCSASGGKLALLDTKVVSYGGGRSKIEVCDIFTEDKQFIHVKSKIKSATLSHLFSQGFVSAQCFRDSRFRLAAREKCVASHQAYFDGDPNTIDYEVVFAIITTSKEDIRTALPFFSKQSCVNAVQGIRALGHPVCISKIEVV